MFEGGLLGRKLGVLAVELVLLDVLADRERDGAAGDENDDRAPEGDGDAVPLDEFPDLVRRTGRAGGDGLAGEEALDVLGQGAGGVVAPGAVLLHRLHGDPVEIAADGLAERAGVAVSDLGDVVER